MRSEGEVVFQNDLAIFQAASTGFSLNFNKKDPSKKLVTKSHGLGWKIQPFSVGFKSEHVDKLAIKAGDYCRLFHREKEGFINVRYNDTELRVQSGQEGGLATDHLFDKFLRDTPWN